MRAPAGRPARDDGTAAQRASWEANARAWIARVRGGDPHRERLLDAAMLAALGPVRGVRVLDAGCGEGRFARRLATRGALVLGVDVAAPLVREARRRARAAPAAVGGRLVFAVADAARLAACPDGAFDAVVSYLSLMHFADPARPLREWARVLAPGGRLVCALPHPFTQAPGARWLAELPPVMAGAVPRLTLFAAGRYYERARVRFRFAPEFPAETMNEHRPLAEWTRLLARAGLVLERLWEPRPDAALARRQPAWAPYRQVPYFLVWRARAAAHGGARGAGAGGLPGRRRLC